MFAAWFDEQTFMLKNIDSTFSSEEGSLVETPRLGEVEWGGGHFIIFSFYLKSF